LAIPHAKPGEVVDVRPLVSVLALAQTKTLVRAEQVEYLARSLSAFYAVMGALCLMLTSDLERYRPLVRFLGLAFALMSLVLLGVDLAAGMPWWWTTSEGLGGVVFGALLFLLARPAYSKGGTA
jgi:hypothetical protein